MVLMETLWLEKLILRRQEDGPFENRSLWKIQKSERFDYILTQKVTPLFSIVLILPVSLCWASLIL